MSEARTARSVAGVLTVMGRGDLAPLRRLARPEEAPAFWRLAAGDERSLLAAYPERWGPIVRALAILTPKGGRDEPPTNDEAPNWQPLGKLLCDGGDAAWHERQSVRPLFSERRLAQLMASRGSQRAALATRALRALATRLPARARPDPADVARLFLRPEDVGPLARHYYQRLDRAERAAETEDTPTEDANA